MPGNLTDLAGNDANLTLPASGLIGGPGPVTVDTANPSAVSVSSPTANGTYAAGAYISVTVLFDEAVYVAGAPLPALELAIGGAGRNATYASGNGSSVIAFNYTVAPGDRADDLDYAGMGALHLNGGAIRDAAGNPADLALPEPGGNGSLGHSKNIEIDAVIPRVVSVSSPGGNGTYGTGRIVEIAVLLDGPAEIRGGAEPRLSLGTAPSRHAEYAGGGNGTAVMTFLYAVRPGDEAARLGLCGQGRPVLEGGSIAYDTVDNASDTLPLPEPGGPGSLGASNRIGVLGGPVPVLAANGSAVNGTGGYNALFGAIDVDSFRLNGSDAYALVVASDGGIGSVQLIRVHEDGTLSAADSAANGSGFSLREPSDVAAFGTGDRAHAIVTTIDGIQMINIRPNGTLSAGSSAENGTGGFDRLFGAAGAAVLGTGPGGGSPADAAADGPLRGRRGRARQPWARQRHTAGKHIPERHPLGQRLGGGRRRVPHCQRLRRRRA